MTSVEQDAFLDAACDLLAVPSTADRPDELRRALEFVVGFVGDGYTVERFESNGKPSALVYRDGGRSVGDSLASRPEFRLVLNGHLDVVPAGPEQFKPYLDGDLLYARGAADMKVTALAQAQAFRAIASSVPYPVALQLVTDEEIGGRDGTRYQLEQGVRAQFVVIGEQSGLEIVTHSKGLLTVHLHATGRGGHGAYPWLADNALLKLNRAIDALLTRYPVPTQEAWSTTVNLARIDTANSAFNQVPAQAGAWLDIRFPPEDDDFNGKTGDDIAEYLQTFCPPGVIAEIDHFDAPHRADRARPEIKLLRAAAQRHGFPAGFLRKHGAADGRFYSQLGMDAVTFGIRGHGQHGPEEYADVTTIWPYHDALVEFGTSLEQRPPT